MGGWVGVCVRSILLRLCVKNNVGEDLSKSSEIVV